MVRLNDAGLSAHDAVRPGLRRDRCARRGPLGAFALLSLTPQGGEPLTVALRAPTPTMLPPTLAFSCLRD
jgi:hypothetical protein